MGNKKKKSSGSMCAITDCRISYDRAKKCKIDISFHNFPKDRCLREKWIGRCKWKKFNPETSRICSQHFTDDDYVRDLRAELLGLPIRRILKPNAIPSQFLDDDDIVGTESDNESRDCEGAPSSVSLPVKSESLPLASESLPSTLQSSRIIEFTTTKSDKCIQTTTVHEPDYKQLYLDLLIKHEEASKKEKMLTEKLTQNETRLKKLESLMKTVFATNQIDAITKNKIPVGWTREEIAAAFEPHFLERE